MYGEYKGMNLINKGTHLSVYCHKTHTHAHKYLIKILDLIVFDLYTKKKNYFNFFFILINLK
jgi:hypothetical protein